MAEVFLNLVNISITASYIAIAVIIFRFLLKKAPKAYTCILWLLVALRLIIPASVTEIFSSINKFSLVPSTEVLPPDFIDSSKPSFNVNIGIPKVDERLNAYLNHRYFEGVTVPANTGGSLMNILGIIWIIVFSAIILYAIGSYIYFRRNTKASICVKGNTFICDYISTPFILGIIKPKILLPSTLSREESRYVLAHEQAHLKRFDNLWKPFGFILLAVHWFNPIMWLSYMLFCRDIELACDEYVIKNMNIEDKKAYSTALLNCSIPKRLVSAYPLAFGEIGVKERIKAVLKYKKPTVITSIIAIILCIITAVCFLSNPQKTNLKEQLNDYIINGISYIEIDDGKQISYANDDKNIQDILNNLEEISTGKNPILDRNFDRGNKVITLYHNNDYFSYNFNTDCTRMWTDNNVKASEIFKVSNPEKVLSFFDETAVNSEIQSTEYEKYVCLNSKDDPINPYVILFKADKSFRFFCSAFSSYYPTGSYEIQGDKLILRTNDGEYIYSFKIIENGLIFDAENSTELPEYIYSSNEDAEMPIQNRDFFELTNG